jgi:dsRNA-specific ribonuclease
MKRTLLLAAAAFALLATNALAEDFRTADIAKLPQDKVAAVKQHCANRWANNFEMQEYCENEQFSALKRLIERGSIKATGEKL